MFRDRLYPSDAYDDREIVVRYRLSRVRVLIKKKKNGGVNGVADDILQHIHAIIHAIIVIVSAFTPITVIMAAL